MASAWTRELAVWNLDSPPLGSLAHYQARLPGCLPESVGMRWGRVHAAGGRPVGCGLLGDSGPGRAPDPAAVRPQAAVIPPAPPTSPVTWRTSRACPVSPGLLAATLPCRAWEGLPAMAGCRGAEQAGQPSGSAAGWHSGCVVGGPGVSQAVCPRFRQAHHVGHAPSQASRPRAARTPSWTRLVWRHTEGLPQGRTLALPACWPGAPQCSWAGAESCRGWPPVPRLCQRSRPAAGGGRDRLAASCSPICSGAEHHAGGFCY